LNTLQINISYEWQPVLLREKVEYLFPMAITPFMRTKYRRPSVFRFIVFPNTSEDKKLVYIGEAQELCPRRLYGFLNPGQTQHTNQRVNTEFRSYLKDKLSIRLDDCNVREIIFGDVSLGLDSLNDKYLRRMLTDSLIIEHKKHGFTVMDI
jgi:hypothetical protein